MVSAVETFVRELLVAVVARPDAAGEVGREPDEPDVVRAGGRTGLAGYRHAALKLQPLAGALADDVLKRAGEQDRGVPRHRPVCFRGFVKHDVALGVEHPGVEDGLGIEAFICNGGVGGGQLQVGHAAVDTAERQRLVGVVGLVQGGDAVLKELVVGREGSEVGDAFDGRDVDGVDDRLAHRDVAAVEAVGVVDLLAGGILIGLVTENAPQRILPGIERGGVGTDDLEGRARLPCRVGRAVERERSGLVAAAADEREHVAVRLVHDDHRGLGLRGHGVALRDDLIAGLLIDDMGLVVLDVGESLLLGGEEQVERRIQIFPVESAEHFPAVVREIAVLVRGRERPVQRVLGAVREIGRIRVLLVHDRLDVHVLGRVDAEAARIEHPGGLQLGQALCLHEVLYDAGSQRVHKIRVDRALAGALVLDARDARVDVVGEGFLLLGLGDVALIDHLIEDAEAALAVLLRVADRVVGARVLGDAGDNGGLGEGEVPDVLVKIFLGGRLDPVGAGA